MPLRPLNLSPEEDTINLWDVWLILFNRKWLILATVVVFAVLSFIGLKMMPDRFVADSVLSIESPNQETLANAQEFKDMLVLSSDRGYEFLSNQMALMTSRPVLKKLADQFGIPAEYLAGKILTIKRIPGTTFIQVSGKYHDPVILTQIVNELVKVYVEYYQSSRMEMSRKLASMVLGVNVDEMSTEDVYTKVGNIIGFRGDSVIGQLRGKRMAVKDKIDQLSIYYKEGFPEIIIQKERMADLDAQIRKELQKMIEAWKQSLQGKNVLLSYAKVITPAEVPQEPVGPNRKMGFLGGMMAGFVLACVYVLLAYQLDPRIKTEEELIKQTGLTCLGWIPKMGKKVPVTFSPYADSPRRLRDTVAYIRTALAYLVNPSGACVMMVTSTLPGEGKSTVASALASSMAEAHEKVVLVDVDMRRPKIHTFYGISSSFGLRDYLEGKIGLDEILLAVPESPLIIIPAGAAASNPMNLLNSKRFVELITELKKRFTKIVLDTPPVTGIADAMVISALADLLFLVVGAGKVEKKMILRAAGQFEQIRGKSITGAIMNFIEETGPQPMKAYYEPVALER